MKHSLLLASVFAFCMGSVPLSALASGSDAVGGARTGDAVAYQQGKRVYATRFACKNCPLYDQRLNRELAEKIIAGDPPVQLEEADANALKVFLKRRFKL